MPAVFYMELLLMRIPSLLFLTLFAASVPADAQDLQFRMQMASSIAESMRPAPSVVTTVSIKGKMTRIDQDLGTDSVRMPMSVLIDDNAGKAFVLMHHDRTYSEVPNPVASLLEAIRDSVASRTAPKGGAFIRTGETDTIAGYVAERRVLMFVAPSGLPNAGAGPATVIQESWVTRDPALVAAYADYAKRAAALRRKNELGAELLLADALEFPLRTIMIGLKGDQSGNADPVAVLKQPAPSGLMMRSRMEVIEVKLGSLPDSLFTVPSNYRVQEQ